MGTAKAKSKTPRARKSAAPKRARGRLAPGSKARGLDAADVAIALDSAEIAEVVALVRGAGGAPIGAYRDPLGGRPLVLASLPLNAVQPTPFQRDLSPTHAKRLAVKIDETAAFLDPLIVVQGEDGRFWTPNGRHRLAAGAYSSFLKKVDRFSDRTLAASLREREGHASRLLEIDARTKKIIEALQAKGFKSPYLRNYVVARINPVRFHKAKKGDTKPPMPMAQALTRMAAAAKNFKVESVSNRDLDWVAVGAGAQE